MGLVRHHNQDINVLIVVAPDLGGRPDSDAGVVRFSDSLALGRASGFLLPYDGNGQGWGAY